MRDRPPRVLVVHLEGIGKSVRWVRARTRAFLTAPGRRVLPAAVVLDVLLVADELVSNAHRHTPGPYTLRVAVTADMVEVAVRDRAADSVPAHGRSDGYGLTIIEAVASEVVVRRVPGGKTVAARVPIVHAPRRAPGASMELNAGISIQ